jgi:hypothetical protein
VNFITPFLFYADGEQASEASKLTKFTQVVHNRDDLNPELLPQSMCVTTVPWVPVSRDTLMQSFNIDMELQIDAEHSILFPSSPINSYSLP